MNLRERLRAAPWLGSRAYWAIALVVLLSASGSVITPLWWLAIAAAGISCALALADALTCPRARDVRVERIRTEPFVLLRAGSIAYRIRNAASRPAHVCIIDSPSRLLAYDLDELRAAIPQESEAIVHRPVTPVQRGGDVLGDLFVRIESSLGFVVGRTRVHDPGAIRVYPDLSSVERYGNLRTRNRLIESGLRRMRLRGTGTLAESVREYAPGDSFRSIDWKATARRGKAMVTEYEIERSQQIMLLLDAGRLMTGACDGQRKFDRALTAALSLAAIAALAGDKVGAVAFAGTILRAFAPQSAAHSGGQVVERLHDVEPRFEESDYGGAFAYVRAHVRKRSLLVFFTDMIDSAAQNWILAQAATLCRHHLFLCILMNDSAIDRALDAADRGTHAAYAAQVALELRDERRSAIRLLERSGAQVVDVPAAELNTELIDRYLRIKQRGLL